MKSICYLIIALFITLQSCDKEEYCTVSRLHGLHLTNVDSTIDSFVVIAQYKKDDVSSQFIDSSDFFAIKINSNNTSPFGYISDYEFSDKDNNGNMYEYIISIIPSGKIYKLTDINYGGETYTKASLGAGKQNVCTQSITYKINGVIHTIPKSSSYSIDDISVEIN